MAIKRGIEQGVAALRDAIGEMSTGVKGKTQIAQVASLSAHDEEMGGLIAEVMEKVGKDGVITVEESKALTTRKSMSRACRSTAATYRPTS